MVHDLTAFFTVILVLHLSPLCYITCRIKVFASRSQLSQQEISIPFRSPGDGESPQETWLGQVFSPVRVDTLAKALFPYPDKGFVAYILNGFTRGFQVGFDPTKVRLHSQGKNLKST